MNRKDFLKKSATLGLGYSVLSHSLLLSNDFKSTPYSFIRLAQTPLAYGLDEMHKVVDKQTMDLHYNKHAAGYLRKLKGYLEEKSIPGDDLYSLIQSDLDSEFLKNNLGGHFNHELYWHSMSPKRSMAGKELSQRIESDFGSWDQMIETFSAAARTHFGSGWAWLILEASTGKLKITTSANQNNPLMKGEEIFGYPIIGVDVWEHAYYLKYQNKRADYVRDFADAINWEFASDMFRRVSTWKN